MRGLADITAALDDVVAFAGRESLTADRFGPLAARAGAGTAAVEAVTALRESFARSVPVLAGLADELAAFAKEVADVDEEAARRIRAAGGE
ncbi:hypothetical protein ACFQV2_35265 [Actinokineospora soli]|uniref:Excreted virulence factor EspC, type VII ESX diderm n=1 Tax=Actinokineospora soli TaxID=1048753 RepID=A0ABW2TVP4_9PSEU